jgi:hypothetical protein
MKHKGPCAGHLDGSPSHSGITLIGHAPPASRLAIGELIIDVPNNGMVLLSSPTFYQMGAES